MSQTRILVADDSKTVRKLVQSILTGAGYQVVLASDGPEALELARNQPPRLAVLDIVMPLMDGYAVCEKFQEMGSPWNEMPIVFLTSIKSQALEMLGSEYGGYMHKPIDAIQLLEIIEKQLAGCTQDA